MPIPQINSPNAQLNSNARSYYPWGSRWADLAVVLNTKYFDAEYFLEITYFGGEIFLKTKYFFKAKYFQKAKSNLSKKSQNFF